MVQQVNNDNIVQSLQQKVQLSLQCLLQAEHQHQQAIARPVSKAVIASGHLGQSTRAIRQCPACFSLFGGVSRPNTLPDGSVDVAQDLLQHLRRRMVLTLICNACRCSPLLTAPGSKVTYCRPASLDGCCCSFFSSNRDASYRLACCGYYIISTSNT